MQSLAGRTILVSGGTSGTGLAAAMAWHGLGAEIVLGARNRERFDAVLRGFGEERVRPLLADLEDLPSIQGALRELEQSGVRPTDVVHCAAAGLEPILRPLMRSIVALRRVPAGPARDEAMDRERKRIAALVKQKSGTGMRVNLEGSRELVGGLAPILPRGARVIALSSLWCETLSIGACPEFYRAVADSKSRFEEWLDGQAGEWALRDVMADVLVGHIISDTGSGKLIDRNVIPLLSEADQFRFRAGYVTTADTVQALTQMLHDERSPSGKLRRVYLIGGEGRLLEALPAEMIALAGRVPL